jgi:hypothetical protein
MSGFVLLTVKPATMNFHPALAIPLFFLLLLLLEAGSWVRAHGVGRHSPAIEGTIFSLFGLLLAFTFSGAVTRFDHHRALIVQEANDIGTAYMRLDLLPTSAQPVLRQEFRDYVTSRLNQFRSIANAPISPETIRLQNLIWSQAVTASSTPGGNSDAAKLLLPALNDMIDITSTRQNAFNMHPPAIVFFLLFIFSAVCAFLAGYSMDKETRSRLYLIAFALIVSVTIYAILEIEYPRQGLIRLSGHDQVLLDLRDSMNRQ